MREYRDVLPELKLKSFKFFYSRKQADSTATFNKKHKNESDNFREISLNVPLKEKDITILDTSSNDLILI